MVDELNDPTSADQIFDSSRLQPWLAYLGLILMGLSVALFFAPSSYESPPCPPPNFLETQWDVLRPWVAWIFGAIGAGCYTKGRGCHLAWMVLGLLPIVGLILSFIGVELRVHRTPIWGVIPVLGLVGFLFFWEFSHYLSYRSRAQMSEARINLGGIFVSETAFLGETKRYGSFQEIGFILREPTNRYTYRSPATGGVGPSTGTVGVDLFPTQYPCKATFPDNSKVPSGAELSVERKPARFTATAVGNIDGDATLDQWHVNDIKENLQRPDKDDMLS